MGGADSDMVGTLSAGNEVQEKNHVTLGWLMFSVSVAASRISDVQFSHPYLLRLVKTRIFELVLKC